MPLDPDLVGSTYEAGGFEVTADGIAAYADATLERLEAYQGSDAVAPPVFGIVPVWGGIQRIMADDRLGFDLARIVHGEQRMRFHRPVRAGDALTSTGTVASLGHRGDNEIVTLTFTTRDDAGEPVLEQDVVVVSRGTAPPEEQRRSVGKPGTEPPAAVGATSEEEPDIERTVDLPEDITYRYANASGDDNAIHVDPEFAERAGLGGIIVHGMCMFAVALQGVVEEVADGDPGRVAAASVRFSRPMRPGEPLTTRIWRTPQGGVFESRDPAGNAVLKAGAAEVRPV